MSPAPISWPTKLANWKRAVEPQAHWMPVYTGLGNHEAILREFSGAGARSVRIAGSRTTPSRPRRSSRASS